MANIKVMSDNLANKIAAGEIVEKCSSVVKELVENSIDAGATMINIHLLNGGRKEIKVIDNGRGMDQEDAINAFLRHATSKLLKEDDLYFIDTLGFRGEALPSIASVADVVLITCQNDIGTLVHIKGGKQISVEPTKANPGTIITVNNLFYNTPARLKFLKNDQAELASCTQYLEKLSLSHPEISFQLTNDGVKIFNTSGGDHLLKTIKEIYGYEVANLMLPIKASNDDYDISGFIGKPELLKSTRQHINTIVNGRIIKNNDLIRYINEAYYTHKPDNKYPVVVLKIDTDPTLIDVNVHPTKQDIKFSKLTELQELIMDSIKKTLYNNLLIPEIVNNYESEDYEKSSNINFIKEEQSTFNFNDLGDTKVVFNQELKQLKLYPVGLVLGTYIIAQNEEGMFIIDQHAAEERINYEKYLEVLKNSQTASISLLIPITIELKPSEYLIFKEKMFILNNIGFKIEVFGINTIIIKEHPIWLKEGWEEESIRKIIEILLEKENFDPVKFNEKLAITLACKLSIKANDKISLEEQEEILNRLVQTTNPYNCPHGRPTIIAYKAYELEKLFKRVV